MLPDGDGTIVDSSGEFCCFESTRIKSELDYNLGVNHLKTMFELIKAIFFGLLVAAGFMYFFNNFGDMCIKKAEKEVQSSEH